MRSAKKIEKLISNAFIWRVLGVVTFFHFWMIVSIYFGAPTFDKANTMKKAEKIGMAVAIPPKSLIMRECIC